MDCGDDGAIGASGGRADGVPVGTGSLALGGVDDHVDGSGLDQPGDRLLPVGADALADLAHGHGVDPVAAQYLCGPGGGQDGETELGQPGHRQDDGALVPVGHGDEQRALSWQAAVGAGLGLGEGSGEVHVVAHDLTGGAHLRSQDRVDDTPLGGTEPFEGQDRFLDGDRVIGIGDGGVGLGQVAGGPERGDRLPCHDEGRRLGELHTGGLRDEGDRA